MILFYRSCLFNLCSQQCHYQICCCSASYITYNTLLNFLSQLLSILFISIFSALADGPLSSPPPPTVTTPTHPSSHHSHSQLLTTPTHYSPSLLPLTTPPHYSPSLLPLTTPPYYPRPPHYSPHYSPSLPPLTTPLTTPPNYSP